MWLKFKSLIKRYLVKVGKELKKGEFFMKLNVGIFREPDNLRNRFYSHFQYHLVQPTHNCSNNLWMICLVDRLLFPLRKTFI